MDIKSEILSKLNFIEEYQRLGLKFASTTPNEGGWVECYAFDRDDKKPSAAVNLQNGFYIDKGGSCRSADFFDMMQSAGGFRSFKDVLNAYCDRFGLEKPKGRPVKTPQAELDILPWNPNGDRWCRIKGTTRDAVERAGGTLCRYQGQYICIGFRIFDKLPMQDTASGYAVAQTDGRELPRFDKSGELVGRAKYKLVAGTKSGLIGTEALVTIQQARQENRLDDLLVVKVEGVSDLVSLLAKIPEEKRKKWLVLTNSGGTGEKPKPAWTEAFAGLDVVVIHDADEPGQMGAKTWIQYLHGVAKSVKNIVLPYPVTQNHGKDLRDFLQENSFDDFLQLIEKTDVVKPQDMDDLVFAPDDPHRIATEYLERHCKIPNHDAIYTLVYQQGMWFRWGQGCYELLPAENLQAILTAFCRTFFLEICQSEMAMWETSQTSENKPLVRKVTKRLVADVLNALVSIVITDKTTDVYWRGAETPEEYSDWKELIPVRNGIVHVGRLSQGRADYLLAPTPMLFHRNILPVMFDPNATSKTWYQMVEQNLQNADGGWTKLSLFQEFMGYCLVPDTSLQKFLLCVGEGSNGKSAVMAGFYAMIGDKNVSNISLEMFSDKFALAQLRSKLVNIVDDMSETDKVCEGKLKSVVSGMSINSDRKNRDGINFSPTTRLIFCCNNPPKFQDKSNGILRRLIMVNFDRTISEHDRDPRFCDVRFWEKESAGIFNWCLAGLIRLRKNGNKLTICEENEKTKQEYIYEINSAYAFLTEVVEQASSDDYIGCSELYRHYSKWCCDNGLKPLSNNNIGKELRRKQNVTKSYKWTTSSKREYVYLGITYKAGVIDNAY